MPEDFRRYQETLEGIRAHREELFLQIKRSQETIARSQELLRRLDDALARTGESRQGAAFGAASVRAGQGRDRPVPGPLVERE
jgi:hypothetical protein